MKFENEKPVRPNVDLSSPYEGFIAHRKQLSQYYDEMTKWEDARDEYNRKEDLIRDLASSAKGALEFLGSNPSIYKGHVTNLNSCIGSLRESLGRAKMFDADVTRVLDHDVRRLMERSNVRPPRTMIEGADLVLSICETIKEEAGKDLDHDKHEYRPLELP